LSKSRCAPAVDPEVNPSTGSLPPQSQLAYLCLLADAVGGARSAAVINAARGALGSLPWRPGTVAAMLGEALAPAKADEPRGGGGGKKGRKKSKPASSAGGGVELFAKRQRWMAFLEANHGAGAEGARQSAPALVPPLFALLRQEAGDAEAAAASRADDDEGEDQEYGVQLLLEALHDMLGAFGGGGGGGRGGGGGGGEKEEELDEASERAIDGELLLHITRRTSDGRTRSAALLLLSTCARLRPKVHKDHCSCCLHKDPCSCC